MRSFSRILGLVVTLGLIGLVIFGVLNFRAIDDWYKLRDYNPPPAVTKLAEEDTMTSYATHVFYVNHPDLIASANGFQQDCPSAEQTIVLGCYHSDQNGIYIYSVNDSRLDGVTEVTAAHEMLHGAYDRLSKQDKQQVDGWLMDYYQNDLHDKRLEDTINAYKKTEPSDVVNEMHSVFGTEVANLPPQLENYYDRYFSHRSVVVTYAAGYEDEFTSRVARINQLESQLGTLKSQISSEEGDLAARLNKIDSDRQRLDGLRASGQVAAYNAAVANFNAEVDAYNSGVDRLRADIAEYNSLVQTHNQLATELRSLYSSLDTSLKTQATQ